MTVVHFVTINCWHAFILYCTWGRPSWVKTLCKNSSWPIMAHSPNFMGITLYEYIPL